MDTIIAFSFLGFLAFSTLALYHLFRRTGKAKTFGIIAGILLLSYMVMVSPKIKEGFIKGVEQAEKREGEKRMVGLQEDIQIGEVRWKVIGAAKKESMPALLNKELRANGVFIIIKLEAEMLGKKGGTIDSTQLTIVDSGGREFSHSVEGQTLLNVAKESLFLKQINPNVPVSGWVIFDIAKDATGLKLKIKDLRTFSDEYGYVALGG